MAGRHASILDELETFALSFPEAWADSPWGDRVVKVRKKIFVFLGDADAARPSVTTKLPDSADHALSFPDAAPTGYGLGKHGWVTVHLDVIDAEELDVVYDFVEESYRAVAPKTLVKQVDAERAADSD